MDGLKEYFNLNEACAYIGISKPTLYAFKQEGLPFYSFGSRRFVKKSEIDAFLKDRREEI